jgi:hypothetical protein
MPGAAMIGMYMAFLINDPTINNTDSLRLYFDPNGNGGDPDTADRFFQVVRDINPGTDVVQAGIGSNSDGRIWNTDYTSSKLAGRLRRAAGTMGYRTRNRPRGGNEQHEYRCRVQVDGPSAVHRRFSHLAAWGCIQ